LNQRLLRPERSALARLSYTPYAKVSEPGPIYSIAARVIASLYFVSPHLAKRRFGEPSLQAIETRRLANCLPGAQTRATRSRISAIILR
jgi:hypothetical protein